MECLALYRGSVVRCEHRAQLRAQRRAERCVERRGVVWSVVRRVHLWSVQRECRA